jgi:hypothetical protein
MGAVSGRRRLADEVADVRVALEALGQRLESVAAMRGEKANKGLGQSTRDEIERLALTALGMPSVAGVTAAKGGAMDRKQFAATNVTIKNEDSGEVEAVFARIGVLDSDGDILVSGAIKNGQAVAIGAWGHASWQSAPPVGRGVVSEEHGRGILRGRFFTETTHGRDAFRTVRALADIQEWSMGFYTLNSGPGVYQGQRGNLLRLVDIAEVSPVLRGAQPATETLAIKDETVDHTALEAIERDFRIREARSRGGRESTAGVILQWEHDALMARLNGGDVDLKSIDDAFRRRAQLVRVGDELDELDRRRLQTPQMVALLAAELRALGR